MKIMISFLYSRELNLMFNICDIYAIYLYVGSDRINQSRYSLATYRINVTPPFVTLYTLPDESFFARLKYFMSSYFLVFFFFFFFFSRIDPT